MTTKGQRLTKHSRASKIREELGLTPGVIEYDLKWNKMLEICRSICAKYFPYESITPEKQKDLYSELEEAGIPKEHIPWFIQQRKRGQDTVDLRRRNQRSQSYVEESEERSPSREDYAISSPQFEAEMYQIEAVRQAGQPEGDSPTPKTFWNTVLPEDVPY